MNNKVTVSIDPDLEPLIPGFLDNRRNDIEILTAALNAGEFATVQSTGHSLKGVGGGYGFALISEIGAELENAAKRQDAEAIQTQIDALRDYLDNIEVVFE